MSSLMRRLAVGSVAVLLGMPAALATVAFGPAASPGSPAWPMERWISWIREAPQLHSFKGVFVVSVPNASSVASSRITHAVTRDEVVERIEALTGPQRITYRVNEQGVTVYPDAKVVRHERLGAWGNVFPGSAHRAFKDASGHYRAHARQQARIAGFGAYRVDILPQDNWRFGYRVWPHVNTGLVLKLQTLAPDGSVLEQSEFSEISLDAQVSAAALMREMKRVPAGYKVVKSNAVATTLQQEGWTLSPLPPGFEVTSCFKRPDTKPAQGWMHCVFSDGMASASLFLERYDPERHRQEGEMALGATHTLVARWVDGAKTEWWATLVGEVPTITLRAILQAMHRDVNGKK